MKTKYTRKKKDASGSASKPFFASVGKIQSKENPHSRGVRVSSPGEKSEKQADEVADSVMRSSTQRKLIQRQAEKEEEPATKIQRQAEKEEEPATKIQRQAEKEEESATKMQRQTEKEEEPVTKIQRQAEEEEEPATKIQRQAEKEHTYAKASADKDKQTNENRKFKSDASATRLENMIKETKGLGTALPDDIRSEMEMKFKADFSQVRIHTGPRAEMMTNMLHAQAFTHGYDIYFNTGQYQPRSSSGKHLLAHELTHVVQQKGNGK